MLQNLLTTAKAVWTKSWTTTWGKTQMAAAAVWVGLSNLYPWVNDSWT